MISSSRDGGIYRSTEKNKMIGAIAGGLISETAGEIFVLYLNPDRRNVGIGTQLLEALTFQQKEDYQASEQWVSVQKGNQKGIPFYEARGFVFKHEQRGYGSKEAENYTSLRNYRPI